MQLLSLKNLRYGFPFVVLFVCVYITYSEQFILNNIVLSNALIFDLLITFPLIYLLVIRKTNIPKTTVIPAFVLGIFIASCIIPPENQFYLRFAKDGILPLVEMGLLAYLLFLVMKGIKLAKWQKGVSTDFHDIALVVSKDLFKHRLGCIVATELSVLYYGILSWKKYRLKAHEFTYHKKTSSVLLLFVIIFLIAIETVALHLLLQDWSTTTTWMLSGISIYTCFQLFAIVKSIPKRPIIVTEEAIKLRWGFMNEVLIPLNTISLINVDKKEAEKSKKVSYLSPFHSGEGTNVSIVLTHPTTLKKMYGIQKNFSQIFVYVDEPEAFVNHVISKQ